ncbi:TonB-dependent receptor [Sphingomonas faeni]|uniref:TonB-dependent receptor n=1 Tax=Sphingomonas faeni TaxID=185950 RepID=UPI00278169DD|nr:TonB-dependent receptor [Sphingomonas faeni]MDQ0839259.1 iron complex outermembrane receptor protein [Sphingomonas faeni]
MNAFSTRGLVASAMALAITVSAPASAQNAAIPVEVPAGSVEAALVQLGRQTGLQILFASGAVEGRRNAPVRGRFSREDALRRVLRGTGLSARQTGPNSYVVLVGGGAGQVDAGVRVQPRTEAPSGPRRRPSQREVAPGEASDSAAADIVVTGSNIRGEGAGTSPVITIDRAAIDRSGRGTIAGVLSTLPQNFGGTGNEETSLTGTDRTIDNTGLASSANLRGLGSDATLTLVNGRRTAGSGGKGDFSDLSTIPIAAVDRIEVLTDGASALYGSDAVAGVVNIILRKTYRGAETRLRAGTTTSGGMQEYQFGQVAGTVWSTGRVLGAYEFERRERLPSAARAYTRTTDLRALGGSDWRSYFAHPGNVLGYDPVSNGYVPTYAIPAGPSGAALAPEDFLPGSANLQNQREGSDLLPDQKRHALYVTAEQQLGHGITAYVEGRAARRRFSYSGSSDIGFISIDAGNPYFVSPDGSPYSLIAYSFAHELGATRTGGVVKSYSLTAGATADIGADWHLDGYYSRAEERSTNRTSGLANQLHLAEALGGADDPDTGYAAERDGYFNPYGDGIANSAGVLSFIGGGYSGEAVRSRISTLNLQGDGSLAALPGGSLRLAVGAQRREEGLRRSGTNFYSSNVPAPLPRIAGNRRIDALFAELAVPLIGDGNAIAGVSRLGLSLAVRHERYSDFGTTTNPKVGVRYEPAGGIAFRASYGRSFRAPSLRETGDPIRIGATQLPTTAGTNALVLFLSGGNPDLDPERAVSKTIGVTIAPSRLGGVGIEANLFSTRFAQRISQPAYQNILQALTDASLAPFVQVVSPLSSASDRALIEGLLADPNSLVPSNLPAAVFGAVVDGRYVNASSVNVRGLDVGARSGFSLGAGRAELSANASYLLGFDDKTTTEAQAVQRAGTYGYPPRLRLRSTVGWAGKTWNASLAANYVSRSRYRTSSSSQRIGSWTTLDLQFARMFGPETGTLNGLSIGLAFTNLLATDPPFVNAANGVGYDATNGSALGRQAALQIVKRW